MNENNTSSRSFLLYNSYFSGDDIARGVLEALFVIWLLFHIGMFTRLCSMRFAKVVPCSNGSTHLGGTLFSCFRFAFVKHLFFTHQLFHVLIFHFITVLRGFCDLVYCCDATEQFFCFWNQKRRRHQRFCNHGSHFQGGDKLDLLFCSLFVFFFPNKHIRS